MFRSLLEGVSSALPSQCAVCAAWPAEPVCDACVARFARPRPRCARCAMPVAAGTPLCMHCSRRAPVLDACFAAVDYAYPWAGCITDFKFSGQPGWAATLAQRIRAVPGATEALALAQVVVPMPLSDARLCERGFNQAFELARQLAAPKVDARVLLRIRETHAQSSLAREARLANVRGAFAVDPLLAHRLAGRHVVLVDDVMTSGASLNEAALQLRSAGPVNITALVIARTDAA